MFNRILIILENEQVNSRAIYYGRELAGRMDAEVSFLMLVEMTFLDRTWLGSKRGAISDIDERVGKLMVDLSASFLPAGIATSTALRVGDLGQELIKFLAERPPFQLILWGSHEELPGVGSLRGHWLAKITDSLECPLWTVSSRRSGE